MNPARPCLCGHPRYAHQHNRRGTDCSTPGCACPSFRRRWFANRGDLALTLLILAVLFAAGSVAPLGR